MNTSKTIRAWHFSNGTLGYEDNRPIIQGLSLACEPDKIGLCNYGFHASLDIRDALRYAPNDTTTISLVELGGSIIEDDGKCVASIRRHLAVANCERTLHEFAIWCAEQALALIDIPDPRSLETLAVKRRWLDGNATDEELADARNDSGTATWLATEDTVMDASGDKARAAAWNAASNAAWAAAWVAAQGTAMDTSGDKARADGWAAVLATQSEQLESMIRALPEFQEAIV